MARKDDYPTAELLAVDIVDDFTKLDINTGWGKTYKASTKMDDIRINDMLRRVMPYRVNKVLEDNYRTSKGVGPIDMARATTIGAVIELFCKKAGVTIPDGFPK